MCVTAVNGEPTKLGTAYGRGVVPIASNLWNRSDPFSLHSLVGRSVWVSVFGGVGLTAVVHYTFAQKAVEHRHHHHRCVALGRRRRRMITTISGVGSA